MKLAVTGSKSIERFDLTEYIGEDVDVIISGGEGGVDSSAEWYADWYGLSKYILRPDFRRYGAEAVTKKLETMVDLADKVLVVWDGKSEGCSYLIRYAQKSNKDIRVINNI